MHVLLNRYFMKGDTFWLFSEIYEFIPVDSSLTDSGHGVCFVLLHFGCSAKLIEFIPVEEYRSHSS
jgi:hypothetical protein